MTTATITPVNKLTMIQIEYNKLPATSLALICEDVSNTVVPDDQKPYLFYKNDFPVYTNGMRTFNKDAQPFSYPPEFNNLFMVIYYNRLMAINRRPQQTVVQPQQSVGHQRGRSSSNNRHVQPQTSHTPHRPSYKTLSPPNTITTANFKKSVVKPELPSKQVCTTTPI